MKLLRVLGILFGVLMLVGGGGCFVLDGFFAVIAIGDPHTGGEDYLPRWWSSALLGLVAFGVAYAGWALIRRCGSSRGGPGRPG
jgi:hypothetical protein